MTTVELEYLLVQTSSACLAEVKCLLVQGGSSANLYQRDSACACAQDLSGRATVSHCTGLCQQPAGTGRVFCISIQELECLLEPRFLYRYERVRALVGACVGAR